MFLYQDAQVCFVEKIVSTNRNGMGQQFPPQLPNWTQVWSPCGAHMKAYFQLSIMSWRGNPGSESTRLNAFAHSGAKERLRHLHSWFWVQFTHDVQIGYKYNNKIKKKKAENKRRNNTQDKKLPTPICYPPPFRFKVIRTNRAIIQDYFSQLWNLISYLHSMKRIP